MRGNIKKGFITVLAVFMILNFSFAAAEEAEEKIDEAAEEKTDEAVEEKTEDLEEYTMLNIMPYLKIPRKELIKYSITQKCEYLDNYYLSKGDKENKFTSVSSPAVSIKYPVGRTYLEGNYAYEFVYYMGDTEEAHRHNATAKLYHRATRRFSIGLTDDFSRDDQAEQEKDIDVKVPGKTFSRNNLYAEAKYEMNKRLRCGVTGNYGFTYFDETSAGAVPERSEFGGGGNIEYVIDKRSTIGTGYRFHDTLFKESDKKDSGKHAVDLRYSRRMKKVFTVVARGSYDFMNYENDENISGVSAGTNLSFDISRLTKFALDYDYGFRDSSKEDYLVYGNHGFGASFNHNLTPRFAIGASSHYNIWSYDLSHNISGSGAKSDKRSEVIGFALTLNYKLTKKIDIGAAYNTSLKFSDFSDDEYFSNHYFLNVRAAF